MDNEIKAQITQKCRSSKVRRITLKEVLDYGRAMDIAEQEASVIEAATRESINNRVFGSVAIAGTMNPKAGTTYHAQPVAKLLCM